MNTKEPKTEIVSNWQILDQLEIEFRCNEWAKHDAMWAFKNKTAWEDLPIQWGHGSSTHYPGKRGGVTTCDIVEWFYFWDTWFRTYGRFSVGQVKAMHDVCQNDNQVQALFEMLNCKP